MMNAQLMQNEYIRALCFFPSKKKVFSPTFHLSLNADLKLLDLGLNAILSYHSRTQRVRRCLLPLYT